ncbi:hypothetical protein Cni_G19654 [Canna indica]|uniref:C2 NT-type domain-containing protein n=1 Tax=Canna indica TaxID=4628 RepID=A0AAQ3KMQ0_9LILI|nr:hypothetical protein Cni_G19654 [Canna indica]
MSEVVVRRQEKVVRMMRWRPWPPLRSKKYEVRLVVRRIEGIEGAGPAAAEVRWKGPKIGLSSIRRGGVRRNWTREEEVGEAGVVVWDEEFLTACTFTTHKENGPFLPWEITITIFTDLNGALKKKGFKIGMASLDLAEFASTTEEKEMEISLPLLPSDATIKFHPTLSLALSLLELRTIQETMEVVQSSIVSIPSTPPFGDAFPSDKEVPFARKAGLRKVNILKSLVLSRKAKKAYQDGYNSEGKCYSRNDYTEHAYPCDTDSDSIEDDLEGVEERNDDFSERKSFSYGTLASTNYVEGSFQSSMMVNKNYEDSFYLGHQKSDVSYSHVEATSIPEQPVSYISKRSILPWRESRLNFKSPKAKGEPLLKKSYGEEGGDDIDFDRRQLCSFRGSTFMGTQYDDSAANWLWVSHFGDDNFVVGSWEVKEVVSRDGYLKLSTQAFFSSIDQRSEQACGESACTVLVAVIADWFQANPRMMPIKSQFDDLIREGSLDWRTLCENQAFKERFPDKHFDLESVIEAKIRPLSIAPAKSFVGFFHPEGTDENDSFNFLHGAMSFDNIWDEINQAVSQRSCDGFPHLYIVSWNDHFFILKVEHDAYYIIDTLGERLHEGCNQAYILKFDDTTTIHKHNSETKPVSDMALYPEFQNQLSNGKTQEEVSMEQVVCNLNMEEELVCRGKESCKEYIKRFLAAIPIRELQVDLRKGLTTPIRIHHRLQIEFHYTEFSKETPPLLYQPALELSVNYLHSTESDSDFSCPVESDLEPSWTREASPDFSLPVERTSEFSWPSEAAFFHIPAVNLEVEVV